MTSAQTSSGKPIVEVTDGKVARGRYRMLVIGKNQPGLVDLTGVFCTQVLEAEGASFYGDSILVHGVKVPHAAMTVAEGKLLFDVLEHPYLDQMFPADSRVRVMVETEHGTMIFIDKSNKLVAANMWDLIFG